MLFCSARFPLFRVRNDIAGTKVEVKLKKAESGSWARLDVPPLVNKKEQAADTSKSEPESKVPSLQ